MNLTIRSKIASILFIVGLAFATFLATLSYTSAQDALIEEAFSSSDAVSETRALQVQQWFNDTYLNLQAYGKNSTVITAIRGLGNALDTSQGLTIVREDRLQILSDIYVGQPDLNIVEDVSAPYISVHSRFHPFFRDTQVIFNYADIILISPDGEIIYSAAKNPDVFTSTINMETDNGLSDLVNNLIDIPSPDEIYFSDFGTYPFMNNDRVAFIGQTLFDDDEFVGLIVFSLTIESLEGLLNLDVGGVGEVFIVGQDKILRTSSVGIDPTLIETEAVVRGLEGNDETNFSVNSEGIRVLSSWEPIQFLATNTTNWVVIVETPYSDVIQPANHILQTTLIGAFLGALILLLISFTLGNQISQPILAVTDAAVKAADGDFSQRVNVKNKDEIGELGIAFNKMVSQLQGFFELLESKVEERTRDLRVTAKITREASQELQLDRMLPLVANITAKDFNLYHVGVYILNSLSQTIEYQADATKTDETIWKSIGDPIWGFLISDKVGLIPLSVRRNDVVIANNIAIHPYYLHNKRLENTKSELVVPMVYRGRVVGVLDLHSDKIDYFTEDNLLTFTALAEQVAVSIQNAIFYEEQVEVAEDMQRSENMKSEFLARMSHELRTPLNSILNFSKIVMSNDFDDNIDDITTVRQKELDEKYQTAINDGISETNLEAMKAEHSNIMADLIKSLNEEKEAMNRDFLGRGVDSANHLLSLITDLLDISKIESGMMGMFLEENVDIGELTHNIVEDAQMSLVDNSIDDNLRVQVHANIEDNLHNLEHGDIRRIRQIIINLISNAIKFTDAGSVSVNVSNTELFDFDAVKFTVKDTGIGIRDEDIDRIFEPFGQSIEGEKKISGTGLGLPITKRLVEAHYGVMITESTFGEGSTFGFILPATSSQLKSEYEKRIKGDIKNI